MVTVSIYAASSVLHSSSAFANVAMYTMKYCDHVTMSLIGFFLHLEISRLGVTISWWYNSRQ